MTMLSKVLLGQSSMYFVRILSMKSLLKIEKRPKNLQFFPHLSQYSCFKDNWIFVQTECLRNLALAFIDHQYPLIFQFYLSLFITSRRSIVSRSVLVGRMLSARTNKTNFKRKYKIMKIPMHLVKKFVTLQKNLSLPDSRDIKICTRKKFLPGRSENKRCAQT